MMNAGAEPGIALDQQPAVNHAFGHPLDQLLAPAVTELKPRMRDGLLEQRLPGAAEHAQYQRGDGHKLDHVAVPSLLSCGEITVPTSAMTPSPVKVLESPLISAIDPATVLSQPGANVSNASSLVPVAV